MEHRILENRLDLLSYLETLNEADVLFRGQISHYETRLGDPSLTSSFQRHGCIPPLMGKWIHYAAEILSTQSAADWRAGELRQEQLHLVQALLQHYGWRSFYVDLSASWAVGGWFASHKFEEQTYFDMCEDVHEEFVLLHRRSASYKPHASTGHLYVVSRRQLVEAGIGAIDLETSLQTDRRTRFSAQRAWLTGPLKGPVPREAILSHVEAPAEVFAQLARERGLEKTASLFPARRQDPYLAALLSVPWTKASDSAQPPIYSRGLGLPEYDYEFEKYLPDSVALYQTTWLSEDTDAQALVGNGRAYELPEGVFHARPRTLTFRLPEISKLLRDGPLLLESAGILRLVERPGTYEYEKGVVLLPHEDGVVEVCALIADHPGSRLVGGGVNAGWHYRVDHESAWTRHETSADCRCKNRARHERHMWVVHVLEDMLRVGRRFDQIGARTYRLPD